MSKSGFFWNEKKSRFSLITEQRFRSTSSRTIVTEEVSKSWMELSSLNEGNYHALAGDEQLRRVHQLLEAQLLKQNRELREAYEKSLNEMEELKKFQGSTFDTFSRRRFIEDRDTILEFSGKIQELQNEVNCLNGFERFSRCWISTQWTIPRSQSTCVFLTFSRSRRNAKPFSEPQQWAAKFSGHAWFFEKSFCKSTASSSAPYPQGIKSLDL